MNLTEEELENLKCAKCSLYLSVGPVTSLDNKFFCGRCPSEGVKVEIYETLAENLSFPCRYESNGCEEIIKWRCVTLHERRCPLRPVICAAVPRGTCFWRGDVKCMADHFKEKHPEDVIGWNLLEIRLHDNLEGCKLVYYQHRHYLFYVYFNRDEKVLKLNVSQLDSFKLEQYELTLQAYNRSKQLKLASVYFNRYNSTSHVNFSKENMVKFSVIKFLTRNNPSIFCKIEFQKHSKLLIPTKILRLMKCSSCDMNITGRVYLCEEGHSVCEQCSILKECIKCNKKITQIRNYKLENIMNTINRTCKNENLGCSYIGADLDIQIHEETCYYYECPLQHSHECKWVGDFKQLIKHCKNTHAYLKSINYGLGCSLTVDNEGVFRLIYSDGVFFKVCRKYVSKVLHIVIQFVGPEDRASDYCYEFGFVGADNMSKICMQDVCKVLTKHENVFDDCMKIPYSVLAPFEENGLLKCNIKIIKHV